MHPTKLFDCSGAVARVLLFIALVTKWVLKNYPFEVTTKVHHIKTIYIKKGKIREWRSYDENHNRIPLVK